MNDTLEIIFYLIMAIGLKFLFVFFAILGILAAIAAFIYLAFGLMPYDIAALLTECISRLLP